MKSIRIFVAAFTLELCFLGIIAPRVSAFGPNSGSENIPQLMKEASLVCKGRILSLEQIGKERVTDPTVQGKPLVDVKKMRAVVKVDRFYKGNTGEGEVAILFNRPCFPPNCWTSFSQGDYALFFLKPAEGGFVVSDSHYAKVEAPPQLSAVGEKDPIKLLEADLKAGLHSENRKEVLTALQLLGNLRTSTSTQELKSLLPSGDTVLEGSVYLALLKLGDYSHLKQSGAFVDAKSAEFQQMKITLPEEMSTKDIPLRICGAIQNIRDEKALPALHEFANSKNDKLRVAAVHALRQIKSPKSLSILISLLGDPLQEVRYLAVSALERTTAGRTLDGSDGPPVDSFKQNEQEYLTKWKTWWIKEGQKKYSDGISER